MTREEVYQTCLDSVDQYKSIMLELATGFGKSKIIIDLINHLCKNSDNPPVTMLLLVAKRIHKQTWQEEFDKWGGIGVKVTAECYESLKKHENEHFDIVLMDEVHHLQSEARMQVFKTLSYNYLFGLSATIPRNLKAYFRHTCKSCIISCDIVEAVIDDVLPEPEILFLPLTLDNIRPTEEWEINPKIGGPLYRGTFKDRWNFKRAKVHAIVSCTQMQKINEINSLIEWEKNTYMRTNSPAMKNKWLYDCGKRLEYLSSFKVPVVKEILKKLKNHRTITFCRTIEQSELLGKNCIHSQNTKADEVYAKFNRKEIKHITAVNILNENANLVECQYAIFANLSSSDIVIPQRLGRAMRHKHPIIVIPYFKGTREVEILEKMFKDYNHLFMRTINSIDEI